MGPGGARSRVLVGDSVEPEEVPALAQQLESEDLAVERAALAIGGDDNRGVPGQAPVEGGLDLRTGHFANRDIDGVGKVAVKEVLFIADVNKYGIFRADQLLDLRSVQQPSLVGEFRKAPELIDRSSAGVAHRKFISDPFFVATDEEPAVVSEVGEQVAELRAAIAREAQQHGEGLSAGDEPGVVLDVRITDRVAAFYAAHLDFFRFTDINEEGAGGADQLLELFCTQAERVLPLAVEAQGLQGAVLLLDSAFHLGAYKVPLQALVSPVEAPAVLEDIGGG